MESSLPFRQPWKCENCGAEGEVPYASDSTPLFVVNSIKRQHNEVSPTCTFDIDAVKVRRKEGQDD